MKKVKEMQVTVNGDKEPDFAHKKPRKPGLLKSKIWVSDNFDDEDEEINKMFYGDGTEEVDEKK